MSFLDLVPESRLRQGARMSSLPVAEFCGLSPRLSSASGRSAVLSSYFHAKCAGGDTSVFALTDEELEEVSPWHVPTGTVAHDGQPLLYSQAAKEVEVRFRLDEDTESVGHLDFAWVYPVDRLRGPDATVAYVADIKRTEWTSEGPHSLQLLAYGASYADMVGARYYTTGIYSATSGEWEWLDRMTLVGGPEDVAIRARIRRAGLNSSDTGNTGAHCRSCFARLKCPEHVMSAVAASAGVVVDEGASDTEFAAAVLRVKALEDVLEQANDNLKAAAERGLRAVDPATGKEWRPITMSGRKSFDAKSIRELPDHERFLVTGKPYQQFRWLNPKEK